MLGLRAVLRQSTFLSSGALAVYLAFAPAAQAEPITLVGIAATAIGGAVGTSAAVITFFGGSALIAGLFGAAVTFGLNYLGAQLFGQQQSPQAQSNLRTRQEDTYPPFRFAIGEFPQEGSLVFKYVDEDYLYFSLLLSSVPIDGSNVVIKVNDIEIELVGDITDFNLGGGAYPNDTEPFQNVSSNNIDRADGDTELLVFWLQTGSQTQFPQDWLDYLSDDLPDIATATWEETAVLHVRCRYGEASTAQSRWFAGVPPKVEIKAKWSKLYDPRQDPSSGVTQATTISPTGTQSWTDPTTWTYSANPALAYLTILMHEKGLAVPQERVIVQMFADAADACDVAEDLRAVETVFTDPFDNANNIILRNSGSTAYAQKTIAYTTNNGRGSLQVSGGNLQMISTDTNNSTIEDELAVWGLYLDLAELGFNPSRTYTVDTSGGVALGGSFKTRYRVVQATNGPGITAAQALEYNLPPDAGTPTVVYDSGYLTNQVAYGRDTDVTGRYVAVLFEGGRPFGTPLEIGSLTVTVKEVAGATKFQCHGLVPIQSREFDTLQGVLDSMAGYLDTSGGGIGIKAGVWDAGTVSPSVQLSVPLAESFNYTGRADPGADKFIGVYLGSHNNYQKTETLPYVLDATGDRSQSIPLSMVADADQAQRITKIMALRARYNRTMQGVWGPEEYGRRVSDIVSFSWPLLQGKADGEWICAEERLIMNEAEDGFVVQRQMAFRETAPEIYDWDPDVDFPDGADVVIAPKPSVTKPGEPQNLVLTSGNTAAIPLTSTATAAADYQAAVRARWEPGTGSITDYEVQFKAVTTVWQPTAIIDADNSFVISGVTYLQSFQTPVTTGATYTVRVRSRGPGGVSDWVSSSIVATAPSGTVRDYSTDYSLDYS